MNNEKQDRAMFVSFCIEQYAKARNMSAEDAANLFDRYGISEHFCEFYDVLHTYGRNWLIEEIDKIIKEKRNEQDISWEHRGSEGSRDSSFQSFA